MLKNNRTPKPDRAVCAFNEGAPSGSCNEVIVDRDTGAAIERQTQYQKGGLLDVNRNGIVTKFERSPHARAYEVQGRVDSSNRAVVNAHSPIDAREQQ